MSASSQTDAVRALAEPVVRASGLVLEDVTVTPAGRRRVLRVVVDLPSDRTGGVPMDTVAEASQKLSAALDESDLMGAQPYVLEVSSPGADRPLTQRRHWFRARGRLLRITLVGGDQLITRLVGVEEDGPVLDGHRRLGWEQIGRARVEVEFAHPEASDDDEGEGAVALDPDMEHGDQLGDHDAGEGTGVKEV